MVKDFGWLINNNDVATLLHFTIGMGSAFSLALRLALPACREGFFMGTTSQTFAGLSHLQMAGRRPGLYLGIIH